MQEEINCMGAHALKMVVEVFSTGEASACCRRLSWADRVGVLGRSGVGEHLQGGERVGSGGLEGKGY